MPVDFMLTLVLLIEALEERLSRCRDKREGARLLKLVENLDGWLERCLVERFSRRDAMVDRARRRLDSARSSLRRLRPHGTRLEDVLKEISTVLVQLNGWRLTMNQEAGTRSEK